MSLVSQISALATRIASEFKRKQTLYSARTTSFANITLSGTQTIEGVAVVAGDVVLVNRQTTGSQNGLYTVAAGAWARTTGFTTIASLVGLQVIVTEGNYAGRTFQSIAKSSDTLGTSKVSFIQTRIDIGWVYGSPEPTAGAMYYDTTRAAILVFDGLSWTTTIGLTAVSNTEPGGGFPFTGMTWWNPLNLTAKIRNGSTWYPIGERLPIGAIAMWTAVAPPNGWLVCDGQAISRATYPELFTLIGTTYGVGNNSTTFNLPNFANRGPRQAPLGETGGADGVTLLAAHLPPHAHSGTTNTDGQHTHPTTTSPSGGSTLSAGRGTNASNLTGGGPVGTNANTDHSHAFTTGNGPGTSTPLGVTSPYLGVTFIIQAV